MRAGTVIVDPGADTTVWVTQYRAAGWRGLVG